MIMEKLRILSTFLFLFLTLDSYAQDNVPNEVLIRFSEGTDNQTVSSFEKLHRLELISEFKRLRVRHYKLPPNLSADEAMIRLGGDPIVELIEKNQLQRPKAIPNDPRFSEQWYLHNLGQTVNGNSGPVDVDIDWSEAMDLYHGNEQIIVAVIDSGVALDHPEIFARAWSNPGELDYTNGIDDDLNGYVDDFIGWDFVGGDNVPLDENGHGTSVASVIGAATNNSDGIAGVATDIRIMALKVMDNFGKFQGGIVDIVTFLLATDYAVQNGARIINYSAATSDASAARPSRQNCRPSGPVRDRTSDAKSD